MTPTRLEILQEARKQAEKVGAVEDGSNYFEAVNGERHSVPLWDVTQGLVPRSRVCGVCIAGACALAEVVLDVPFPDVHKWLGPAQDAARQHPVSDVYAIDDTRLTTAITELGTPYVLEVLDIMIQNAEEAIHAEELAT